VDRCWAQLALEGNMKRRHAFQNGVEKSRLGRCWVVRSFAAPHSRNKCIYKSIRKAFTKAFTIAFSKAFSKAFTKEIAKAFTKAFHSFAAPHSRNFCKCTV